MLKSSYYLQGMVSIGSETQDHGFGDLEYCWTVSFVLVNINASLRFYLFFT